MVAIRPPLAGAPAPQIVSGATPEAQANKPADLTPKVELSTHAPIKAGVYCALDTHHLVRDVATDRCLTMAVVTKMLGNIKDVRQMQTRFAGDLNQLLDVVLQAAGVQQAPRTYFIGDIEGREQNNLMPLIANLEPGSRREGAPFELVGDCNRGDSFLKFTEAFAKSGAKLVFLGDLGDRGPMTIRMRRWLMTLAMQYPGRVQWVPGNREFSKLAVLNDLMRGFDPNDVSYLKWLVQSKLTAEQRATALGRDAAEVVGGLDAAALQNLVATWHLDSHASQSEYALQHFFAEQAVRDDPEAYNRWLLAKRNPLIAQVAGADTEDVRLEYWLSGHSARGALEYHRKELSLLAGHEVSSADAAVDYLKSWSPSGEAFEFLAAGAMGLGGNTSAGKGFLADFQSAWHGGSSEGNVGYVPGVTSRLTSPKAWIEAWAQTCAQYLEQARQAINASKAVPQNAIDIGESSWDSKHGINSANIVSPIYGERTEKADRQFAAFDVASENYFLKPEVAAERIKHELNGHTPMGAAPLSVQSAGGIWRSYLDTSMDTIGSEAITARVGDLTVSVYRIGTGEDAKLGVWVVKPGAQTPIGAITDDGYTVRGVTFAADGNGGVHTEYDLFRYAGYEQQTKSVDKAGLAALHPRAYTVLHSSAADAALVKWHQTLAADKRFNAVFEPAEVEGRLATMVAAHGFPIAVHAASKYGQLPGSPAEIERSLVSLEAALGDHPHLMGGTDSVRPYTATGPTDPETRQFVASPETVLALLRGGENAILGVDDADTRNKLKVAAQNLPCKVAATPTLGTAPMGTELNYFGLVRDLLFLGAREHWDEPLLSNVSICERFKGAAVFIGGGSMMDPGVEQALAKVGLKIFLMVPKPGAKLEAGNDGGASARWAAIVQKARKLDPKAYPNVHIVACGDDLGGIMKSVMGSS